MAHRREHETNDKPSSNQAEKGDLAPGRGDGRHRGHEERHEQHGNTRTSEGARRSGDR
jgi:hypothetical protein